MSSSPIVSLSKKLYTHCLVLVDFSNGFECYLQSQKSSQKACLTMELKIYSINSETTDDVDFVTAKVNVGKHNSFGKDLLICGNSLITLRCVLSRSLHLISRFTDDKTWSLKLGLDWTIIRSQSSSQIDTSNKWKWVEYYQCYRQPMKLL